MLGISPIIPASSDMEKTIEFYEQKLALQQFTQRDRPLIASAIISYSKIFLLKKQKPPTKHAANTSGAKRRVQILGSREYGL